MKAHHLSITKRGGLLLVLFLFVSLACSLGAGGTPEASTSSSNSTEPLSPTTAPTSTPEWTSTNTPPPSATLIPSITPSPSPTLTPTLPPAPTLPAPQINGWDGALPQALCVNVTHNIAPLKASEPDPIQWSTSFIARELGLPVDWEKTSCDATLKVNVSAQALGATYTSESDGTSLYCYTGAKASVDLTLSGGGNSSRAHGEAKYDVTDTVYGCPEADEAPYQGVWEDSLLQALDQMFGKAALVAALRHPLTMDANISGPAGELLEGEPFEALFPLLMPGVAAGDGNTALFAANQYGAQAAPIVPYLADRLAQTPSESFGADRDKWAEALGLVGPAARDAVPALIGALSDQYYDLVTSKVAEALGRIGPGAAPAVPALLEALARETDQMVRYTIIIAIGNIGPAAREAVPALIDACYSGEQYDRTYAIMSLGQIGPDAWEAVPALIAVFSGDSDFDMENAATSLQSITGQNFGQNAGAWQDWWDSQDGTSPATSVPAVYLDQFEPTWVELGYGVYSVGTFNFSSEDVYDNINRGDPLILKGVEYPHGLFAHAPSRLSFDLGGNFSELTATLGLVEWIDCGDGVEFVVLLDGDEVYHSPTLYASSDPLSIQVPIPNGDKLTLVVETGPEFDNRCDWAIWGDPQLR